MVDVKFESIQNAKLTEHMNNFLNSGMLYFGKKQKIMLWQQQKLLILFLFFWGGGGVKKG